MNGVHGEMEFTSSNGDGAALLHQVAAFVAGMQAQGVPLGVSVRLAGLDAAGLAVAGRPPLLISATAAHPVRRCVAASDDGEPGLDTAQNDAGQESVPANPPPARPAPLQGEPDEQGQRADEEELDGGALQQGLDEGVLSWRRLSRAQRKRVAAHVLRGMQAADDGRRKLRQAEYRRRKPKWMPGTPSLWELFDYQAWDQIVKQAWDGSLT